MYAMRIVRDFVGPLGVKVALVACLIAAVAAMGTADACKRCESEGKKVAASIEIDGDGIVIRTEGCDHDEYDWDEDLECLDIYLDEDFLDECDRRDLRRLRRAGIFDIDECGKDDIVRFGKDIYIRDGKKIRGDVVAIGGSVFVEGRIYGDVVAIGGSVVLEDGSQIKGDAVVLGGDLELLDGSHVTGDAVAIAGSIEDEEGAHVGGDMVSMQLSLW